MASRQSRGQRQCCGGRASVPQRMNGTVVHAGGDIETIVAAYWIPSDRISILCSSNSREKTMAAYKESAPSRPLAA